MDLPQSDGCFVKAYPGETTEAFLDGHVSGFAFFGGVPLSGTPQVLRAHHLKQLKLPTVLREYDKVARECARDGVAPPRSLLRLIELELIARERRTIDRRIGAAGFPAVKSFDTFDFAAI